jgi:phosphomethylpyrimidine synthase
VITVSTETVKVEVELQKTIHKAALKEKTDPNELQDKVASGRVVVVKNRKHQVEPLAIGEGLRTKVNANLGTSPERVDLDLELKKAETSIKYGADTIMDLSTGGNLKNIRQEIIKNSSVPIGTVPIYEVICQLARKKKTIADMEPDQLFEVIEGHLEDGVDFLTVHCGVTRAALPILESRSRVTGVVSRGGSFLVRWMRHTGGENPLYEQYDRLLELAKRYDSVLSLGDGLRPGSLADATDSAQVQELTVLGELVKRAKKAGVQVMVEGPGHIPLQEVEANVLLEKKLCDGAPFYVLGPLVTDCAAGYDHISGAIGGAIAAAAGADFLCYVTPAEHLSLPDVEDVRQGVIASVIAAHAGDIAKGVSGALERDNLMSKARKSFDWETAFKYAFDPEYARRRRGQLHDHEKKCSMCGEFCAMREEIEFKTTTE